jgi:putative endonuclease
MSNQSNRALAARARATKRWYVYLILCRRGAIYTGIARNVAVRYARHVAGTGARYTRANPPRRLLVKFACLNQSEASKMEAAIKKLAAANKRKLVDKSGATVRKLLFGCPQRGLKTSLKRKISPWLRKNHSGMYKSDRARLESERLG